MSQNAHIYLVFRLISFHFNLFSFILERIQERKMSNALGSKSLSQHHRIQFRWGKIKTELNLGKCLCVCVSMFLCYRYVLILMISIPNSVKCSSSQSTQAKITEIGAFHESAPAQCVHTHKRHLTEMQGKTKTKIMNFLLFILIIIAMRHFR